MGNFVKTSVQIKEHMFFWFLRYHHKTIDQFNGTEQFTFFDKLFQDAQKGYADIMEWNIDELPVFILHVSNENSIINTTHRFIRLNGTMTESIDYKQFDCHTGFKSISATNGKGKQGSIKTDGFVADFGLRKTDGETVYWKIPTGKAGFAFWNITNKCDLIGRKYIQ